MEIASRPFPLYLLFICFKNVAFLLSDGTVLWEPHICELGSRCPNKDMDIIKLSMILGKGGSPTRKWRFGNLTLGRRRWTNYSLWALFSCWWNMKTHFGISHQWKKRLYLWQKESKAHPEVTWQGSQTLWLPHHQPSFRSVQTSPFPGTQVRLQHFIWFTKGFNRYKRGNFQCDFPTPVVLKVQFLDKQHHSLQGIC